MIITTDCYQARAKITRKKQSKKENTITKTEITLTKTVTELVTASAPRYPFPKTLPIGNPSLK